MDNTTLLGLVAGSLTTAAFFPQFLKAWKSRSTKDVSLLMYVIISTGVLLWLIYGLIIGSLPVIAANAVTLLIAGAILILKIRFR